MFNNQSIPLFVIQRNVTDSGVYTIESGANGIDQLGFIKMWEGKSELDYWHGDRYCNMLNGIILKPSCTVSTLVEISEINQVLTERSTHQK